MDNEEMVGMYKKSQMDFYTFLIIDSFQYVDSTKINSTNQHMRELYMRERYKCICRYFKGNRDIRKQARYLFIYKSSNKIMFGLNDTNFVIRRICKFLAGLQIYN